DLDCFFVWSIKYHQSRPSRTVASSLCICIRRWKQWIGLRGTDCEHNVVQRLDWHDDVDWPILHDHSNAGDCRQSGAQKDCSSFARYISRYNAFVHSAAGERDHYRRCSDVFPGAQLRTDRRAFVDECRKDILKDEPQRHRGTGKKMKLENENTGFI